jgi:hypothetical protein
LNGAFGSSRPFTQDWFDAILAASPWFSSHIDSLHGALFETSNADRIRWLLVSALETVELPKRAEMMIDAIRSAQDITVLCDLVRTVIRDLHPEGAVDVPDGWSFVESDATAIRTALLHRVRNMAQTGEIWSQADPRQILWFWWGSNLEAEVQDFTRTALATSIGTRGLLDVVVSKVRSSAGDYEHVNKSAGRIINLDALAIRA